ncbi:dockerin type I repeat-containing protein [Thermosulfurimonas dismutans]|uniref:dockerin type I repeat-containing protein n=1 Tax=Thermosulfurimonas dismutans TaxID=999894 RepID=UPI0012946ACF|nr:dockerin type I repeat-containing protein [Thermosulfurimonas dismutans]
MFILYMFILWQAGFAQEVFYPLYTTSLPPLRSFALAEWGDTTGIVVEAPEDTVAIDLLVNAPGTKLLVYEISVNGDEITSKTKIGEALSQGPGWLRVPIPKTNQKKLFYLKINFQEAEGYSRAVIADAPVWPKDSFWMVSQDRWLWRLDWGEDHPYGGVDNTGLVPRPYLRFVREGNFRLKRFEPQPGVVLQGAKVRFKVWCFGACPALKLDLEGDGIFDFILNRTNSDVTDFYYGYENPGIYYPKLCLGDGSECFESVVVVGPTGTEVDELFSENFVVYWPKSKAFLRPYAERLLKYLQRAKDTGYFAYWGFEKDWGPALTVYYYSADIEFAQDLCRFLSGNIPEEDVFACSNEVTVATYVEGTVFWHIIGGLSSHIAAVDVFTHESAHTFDHVLNLSRALGSDYEIIPMWRHEGLVITFSRNPYYGHSRNSRHATAREAITSGKIPENFIHLRSNELLYSCGGATTECYVMSSSMNSVVFPIFWANTPQEKIVEYWKALAYRKHEEVFPEIFGVTDDDLWQKILVWAEEDIPIFTPPELKVVDSENLEFKLNGSGEYFVLVYINGSAFPTGKLRVLSGQPFSLKEFKSTSLKSLRLFVRQVKDSTSGLPLLSEAGRDFLLVFEPETSHLLHLSQYNGGSVIYSSWLRSWEFSPESMLYQVLNNFPVIPEMLVRQERICFDFRPFLPYISVEAMSDPAEWYLPPPPEDSNFHIEVANFTDELQKGVICYSGYDRNKYALFHMKANFVQEYYGFSPVDQYLAIRLPVIKSLYVPVCTPDGDVAPLGARDGKVNIGDALVTLRFALGLETPSEEDKCHADAAPLGPDGTPQPDGRITIGDALVILRKALGLVNW